MCIMIFYRKLLFFSACYIRIDLLLKYSYWLDIFKNRIIEFVWLLIKIILLLVEISEIMCFILNFMKFIFLGMCKLVKDKNIDDFNYFLIFI